MLSVSWLFTYPVRFTSKGRFWDITNLWFVFYRTSSSLWSANSIKIQVLLGLNSQLVSSRSAYILSTLTNHLVITYRASLQNSWLVSTGKRSRQDSLLIVAVSMSFCSFNEAALSTCIFELASRDASKTKPHCEASGFRELNFGFGLETHLTIGPDKKHRLGFYL